MDATALLLLAAVVAVLLAAGGVWLTARRRTPSRERGADDARALNAARAALDAARQAGAQSIEQARHDALQLREAAMEEVRARHDALEATERRIADRHRDLLA